MIKNKGGDAHNKTIQGGNKAKENKTNDSKKTTTKEKKRQNEKVNQNENLKSIREVRRER